MLICLKTYGSKPLIIYKKRQKKKKEEATSDHQKIGHLLVIGLGNGVDNFMVRERKDARLHVFLKADRACQNITAKVERQTKNYLKAVKPITCLEFTF